MNSLRSNSISYFVAWHSQDSMVIQKILHILKTSSCGMFSSFYSKLIAVTGVVGVGVDDGRRIVGVVVARGVARGVTGGAARAAGRWSRSELAVDEGGLLQGGIEVQRLAHQLTGGAGLEFHTLNVLGDGEVLL